ncbi:uncharacterized protein RHO17_016625 [Thomomys bottae]
MGSSLCLSWPQNLDPTDLLASLSKAGERKENLLTVPTKCRGPEGDLLAVCIHPYGNSSTVLERNGESRHPCLIPELEGTKRRTRISEVVEHRLNPYRLEFPSVLQSK